MLIFRAKNLAGRMDGRMDGRKGGWVGGKAGLRIAYSNQKIKLKAFLGVAFGLFSLVANYSHKSKNNTIN